MAVAESFTAFDAETLYGEFPQSPRIRPKRKVKEPCRTQRDSFGCGTTDYRLWLFSALLAVKMLAGFYKIRKKL